MTSLPGWRSNAGGSRKNLSLDLPLLPRRETALLSLLQPRNDCFQLDH